MAIFITMSMSEFAGAFMHLLENLGSFVSNVMRCFHLILSFSLERDESDTKQR